MAKVIKNKPIKKAVKNVLKKAVPKKNAAPKTSKALLGAALIAVRDCLGAKEGESVLVITDVNKRNIGYAIWEAARGLNTEAMLLEIKPRSTNGEEPPPAVAEMMGGVDVCLCPTTKSLTHTKARKAANEKGARIATLPGITEDMMVRCLNADYNRVAELSIKLKKILDPAKVIRVTSKNGTDITMPKEGRISKADTGIVHNKGEMSNLPAGETFLAPLEGLSNGVVVVDGSMAGVGVIKKNKIRIVVKDGYATEVTGGKEAEALVKLFEPHGLPARNVAEFGIGTNYKAKLTGAILEDEKVMGTIHIAFGNNFTFGGTVEVPSHLDGLVKNPNVEVDGRLIMKDGKFVI
jgi:aminopeptidase